MPVGETSAFTSNAWSPSQQVLSKPDLVRAMLPRRRARRTKPCSARIPSAPALPKPNSATRRNPWIASPSSPAGTSLRIESWAEMSRSRRESERVSASIRRSRSEFESHPTTKRKSSSSETCGTTSNRSISSKSRSTSSASALSSGSGAKVALHSESHILPQGADQSSIAQPDV